ncbi:MAG: PAS domain S-box protein, partial [Candidatus Heimdallarchaeota archaeon]|nr:PAS domain S-box protein [Candidatus Heimdallarchaeota archaeon]
MATSVFIVYGIVGGLIVPAADFFPADILNYDNFLAATQIPVQVIRAASAIIVAFSVTHILKMFRWEADSKLEDSLKQAHDALASVEQLSRRNKILLQYSGHGILGVNKKGIFTFANPVALKILASKESEIIGRSVEIIRCKEKDHEYLLGKSPIIEAVYKGVMKQVYDAELQRTDGSMITIDYQVMPVSETGEEDVSVITFQDVSERKIIEQKLVKLSRVVEQSPVSIVITDKNGTIEYINPKFSKLTGYELADAVGENPRILNSGNQSREFYQDMWQTISSGSQWEGELLNKKKGGELFWEKALISPIVDKQNKVTNYVAVKEDITHRKKMEEEIYSTMQHLRLYREQAPLGGIEWDTNFCVVEWNAAAEKIFGYTYNEAKGNNPLKFLMPEYVVTDIEQIWDALITQTGGEKSINENITKDGRVILCEWHNAPLRDESGKVVGVASVVQDITERFQAEQSLKRVNRSLQALSACNEALVRAVDEKELLHKVCKIIVDISGYRIAWVGFVEHDNEKSIRPMAQAGCQEGYLDNLILSWDDVLTEQQSPAGKAIRTGEPCIMRNVQSASTSSPTGDITIKSDNYSTISLPIKNKDQIFGALSICAVEQDAFDSDEIKLLQELSDDLAFGITTLRSHQERHHLNRQLQQAQKMEAVGQLTGGIAHDFNNILSSILGFTNLALQRFVGDDQPKLQKYLTEVVRAGERARDLVAQMLAFSRTDTRKASHMQLLPMIKEVTKMLQVTLPSSIELSNNFEGGVPDVLMNPVHMQQVLMNLCINARDAIEGSGSINISVRPVFAGNFDKNNST